jgi:hypothetical protein
MVERSMEGIRSSGRAEVSPEVGVTPVWLEEEPLNPAWSEESAKGATTPAPVESPISEVSLEKRAGPMGKGGGADKRGDVDRRGEVSEGEGASTKNNKS